MAVRLVNYLIPCLFDAFLYVASTSSRAVPSEKLSHQGHKMKDFYLAVVLVTLVGISSTFSVPAKAQTTTVDLYSNLGDRVLEIDPVGLVSLSYGLSNSELDLFADALAQGSVQFGTLRAKSSAQASRSSVAVVSSIVNFQDTLKLDAGQLNGTSGYARFDIRYLWSFFNPTTPGVEFDNRALISLDFAGSTAYAERRRTVSQDANGPVIQDTSVPLALLGGAISNGANPDAFFSVDVPVIFGVDYNLALTLSVATSVQQGDAGIDSLNSVYWGGVSAFDSSLESIPFIALSGSGTNYRQSFAPVTAIPEPAPALQMAVGLVMLVGAVLQKTFLNSRLGRHKKTSFSF